VQRGIEQGAKDMGDFVPYIILFVGSLLLGEMMWRLGIHFAIKTEVKAVTDLYEKGLSQLLRQDLRFFHDNFAGSLTKRTIAYAVRYIDVFDTMIFNVSSSNRKIRGGF